MKTPLDPRHKRRKEAMRALFRHSFNRQQKIENKLARKVLAQEEKIDKIIQQAAPEWPIKQINRVDLAILRLSIWELAIAAKEPPKVIIDEAIELAKTYGSRKSPSFINGVLGTVYKKYPLREKNKDENTKAPGKTSKG